MEYLKNLGQKEYSKAFSTKPVMRTAGMLMIAVTLSFTNPEPVAAQYGDGDYGMIGVDISDGTIYDPGIKYVLEEGDINLGFLRGMNLPEFTGRAMNLIKGFKVVIPPPIIYSNESGKVETFELH